MDKTIFFDLNYVLLDPVKLQASYRHNLGQVMEARYGSADWVGAYDQIVADWDSYHADLDFGGDDGLEHMDEGLFRTTRALFLMTGVAEPAKSEITELGRTLFNFKHDAIYDEVEAVLQQLDHVGIISYRLSWQTRAILQDILPYFDAPIIGPDTVERFHKDEDFFRRVAALAGTSQCVLVDSHDDVLANAEAAGFCGVHFRRTPQNVMRLLNLQ